MKARSLIRGAGSVLDLWGRSSEYHGVASHTYSPVDAFLRDAQALESDWRKIDSDLRAALVHKLLELIARIEVDESSHEELATRLPGLGGIFDGERSGDGSQA